MTAMDQQVTRGQAAAVLDVSVRTLERWARQGIGPRPVKRGPRLVRYSLSELETFRATGEVLTAPKADR